MDERGRNIMCILILPGLLVKFKFNFRCFKKIERLILSQFSNRMLSHLFFSNVLRFRSSDFVCVHCVSHFFCCSRTVLHLDISLVCLIFYSPYSLWD